MVRSNNRTAYFVGNRVITLRKRRRFKIGKNFTPKQAFTLTLAELSVDQALLNRWRYNKRTGWVSVELK